MKQVLFLILISFYVLQCHAQNDSILDKGKRLQTDVFILNTCEPNQLSLVKMYDDNRFIKKMDVRRLSISTRKFTAFKIININPLRYNYYINNQLVTNFMEAGVVDPMAALNGANRSVQEIEHLNLFSELPSSTDRVIRLREIEAKITVLKDSVRKMTSTLSATWKEFYQLESYDTTEKKYIPLKGQEKKYETLHQSALKLQNQLSLVYNDLFNAFNDMETISNSLPINDRNFSILDVYSALSTDSQNTDISIINKACKQFADSYKLMSISFDSVELAILDYNLPNADASRDNSTVKFDELMRNSIKTLSRYGYSGGYKIASNNILFRESSSLRESSSMQLYYMEELYKLKTFMLNKKYQAFESFIITTASDISRILQNTYREYSERYISANNSTCLAAADISNITQKKNELKRVFARIEEVSTDFKVMTSYMGIDNKLYKPLIDTINKNYRQLYKYVKYFSHIENNSTVEYSLPTHTNLKNVDLVRYEIKREDKLATASQTQTQTYVYDLWLKGGLKVDLSAGIFASGLVDNEYEKIRYAHAPNPAGLPGDSIGIIRREPGGYNFAFGGMVNITPRAGANWVNMGMSYGVIYSSNQKLQFLSALSLHLGKMERIILHGGVTFGFVQSIDRSKFVFSEIKKRDEYALRADFESFTVPYIERFKTAAFFGITYNLSKKNALQAVSDKGLTKYDSLMDDTRIKTVQQ